jgi:hypothetical protein
MASGFRARQAFDLPSIRCLHTALDFVAIHPAQALALASRFDSARRTLTNSRRNTGVTGSSPHKIIEMRDCVIPNRPGERRPSDRKEQ